MKTFRICFFSVFLYSAAAWADGPNFASDITITTADPDIELIDSGPNDTDWELCVDDNCRDTAPVSESFAITWDDANPANTGAPFIIETGTADHLLYLDANERVGINTNVPADDLHVAGPAIAGTRIRLDPLNGSDWRFWAGSTGLWFTSQDGSPTNPVKFNSNAPDNSLVVESGTGDIGMGIGAPAASLHVRGSSTTQILVENTSAAAGADRVMYRLKDASNNKLRFAIEGQLHTWTFDNSGNNFQINKVGTGVNEFRFEDDGDSRQRGRSFATNHINTSSREAKTDFAPVDHQVVLEKLLAMPISQWRYKKEASDSRHIGPVAEDFQASFGLSDGKHISTVDASGVALAAIKGLNQRLEEEVAEKDATIEALRKANDDLQERMARLEQLLLNQAPVANR